jgi:uncharacterized protein YigA (DUF484 family)
MNTAPDIISATRELVLRLAVPQPSRDALGMPDASLAECCERIRTLRQTELSAQHMHRRATCR